MHLFGTFESSIDAKSRFSIPAAMRESIDSDRDGREYFVLPGRTKGTLAIYPDRYFLERIAPNVQSDLELPDAVYEWLQFECSQTARVQPDTQGRIVLPEWLVRRAGIAKDVTLIGVRDHMELWRRDAYETFIVERMAEYPKHRVEAARELAKLSTASGTPGTDSGEQTK